MIECNSLTQIIMKNFELKFGSIKEMLSKDQMKTINGGSCTWYWNSDSDCAGGSSVTSGNQEAADTYCWANDCCDNVDCT